MNGKSNFACRMDSDLFRRLSDYCTLSRQSKTAVVEMALERYLAENADRMRRFMDGGAPDAAREGCTPVSEADAYFDERLGTRKDGDGR